MTIDVVEGVFDRDSFGIRFQGDDQQVVARAFYHYLNIVRMRNCQRIARVAGIEKTDDDVTSVAVLLAKISIGRHF